ncbi:MAG: transrane protein [Thermoleophilia bacterium]|nr:transrane protein [Thermoleophilia bacterium]
MGSNRLEAFSDGVLAIVITIMVLELDIPGEPTWHALGEVVPTLLSYLLSFVYIGIYWNNHHHMVHLLDRVNGGVLWANLHLLFWLSLVPFSTRWLDESGAAEVPVVVYGINLLLAAIAFYVMVESIFAVQGRDGALGRALGANLKGKLSPVLYVAGIALTFVAPWLGLTLFALVALVWLVPDRRVEGYVTRDAA